MSGGEQGTGLDDLVTEGAADAATAACLAVLVDASAVRDRAGLVARCARIVGQGWWSGNGHTPEQYDAAVAVVTALATEAELRRMPRRVLPPSHDDAHRLLAARDATFRDRWVDLVMADVNPAEIRVARRLIHAGLAAKPTTDDYTVAMVGRPSTFDATGDPDDDQWQHPSVLTLLRTNPDLLDDDIWRIFEVEGGGEHSLAAHDKYCDEDETWRHAVVTLSQEGVLDRQRLLDASLDALQRGFAQFRAQWFAALHEALTPTVEERTARASTYLALTASPVGPTASMALKALGQVQKTGRLDPVEVVRSIGPALLTPAKGSATKAISLLAAAVRSDATLTGEAAAAIVPALGHPSDDVQKKALDHLRRWAPEPDLDLAGEVAELRDGCHPSVRATIDEWLGTTAAPPRTDPDLPKPPEPDDTISSAPPWGEADVVEITPVTAIDRLTPDRELVPIDDLDLLLEQVASAIEAPPGADELEVLLTSMARHGREPTAGHPQTTTIARRAAKLTRSERVAQRLLARAATAWLAPDRLPPAFDPIRESPPPPIGSESFSLHDLLVARLEEVISTLATGVSHIPLAAPTHRGGFLDPCTLAARLAERPEPFPPAELLTALLRLAPDRTRLAAAVSTLQQGDDVAPEVIPWLQGWADHCEADAATGGRWTCEEWTSQGGYRFFDLHLEGTGDVTPPDAVHVVTIASSPWGRCRQDPTAVGWMSTLIPGLPAAFAREGATTIGPTYGTHEVSHGDAAYLERFFDPAEPLVPACLVLLAFALNDHRAGIQAVAVDLAIDGLDQRRLDVAGLGEQIGRLASTGLVTPKRWSRSLADLAGHGPIHRLAVVDALEQAVATAEPRRPQDVLPLVDLLEVLLVEEHRAVRLAGARAALARITGSSKTAKTAERLLARESP